MILIVGTVLISVVLGLLLALLLDRAFLGRGIVRTLLITPFLVTPVAGALMWKTAMLDPVFGIINWVLSPFGVHDMDWVSRFPLTSVMINLVWQWTPFMMLLILAGLHVDAARHPRGRPGRRCGGVSAVPRVDAARTCGGSSNWAPCWARSIWSTPSTRST